MCFAVQKSFFQQKNEKIRDKNINAYINVSSVSFLLAPIGDPLQIHH
jgi:hypothetical protein